MALSVKKLTWIFAITALASALGATYEEKRIRQIEAFNAAVSDGK